jgi:hypothetical protein
VIGVESGLVACMSSDMLGSVPGIAALTWAASPIESPYSIGPYQLACQRMHHVVDALPLVEGMASHSRG